MRQRVVPVSAFLGRHMYACIASVAQYTLGEADCIGGTVRGEGSEAALVVFAAQLQVVIKLETERPRISLWSPTTVDQKSAMSGKAHFETSASS